jgi:Domain of unknown function (DUF4350)
VESRKFLPAVILFIILSLSVVVWFYPSNEDFRVDNPFWNGLSSLNEQAKVVLLNSLVDLPSEGKGTALLLVPYLQFSDAELEQIRGYVSVGGTLVLLDDYGFGNQVLSRLNLNMRFSGKPLLDPLFDYRNKWLPRITDLVSTPLSVNVSSVVFNHATVLNDTSDASVVAFSSSFSFLDKNSNGEWDDDELYGPFVVAAYTKMDQGYVVAISDPSFLINGMLRLDDNSQFISNVLSLHGSNPQVFVDQSHLPKSTLDDAKADLAVVYGAVASPIGTLILIVIVLTISLKALWKNEKT